MTGTNLALLATATLAFIGAGSSAKAWALADESWAWLALTLVLYTVGNLIMLRLVRELGMGVALSVSALVQLIAINVLAVSFFGEILKPLQAGGIVLAIVAVALITLPA